MVLVACSLLNRVGAQLPSGFVDELITDQVNTPVGVEFVDSQLIYIWTQDGLILIWDQGALSDTLLDLRPEVSAAGDHGMLGLAIDPNFDQNGFLYISYVVDPHYLLYYNTPSYDPPDFDEWDATIGRVARYQVEPSKRKLANHSRDVLLGEHRQDGIPILAPAHGVGGLAFGNDGTLLIGTGDGTTWVGNHTGGDQYKEFGFDSLGKALGIIDSISDVGSYRSQMLDSYSGKILRIDPITGLGVASNPFFDPEEANSPRSKIWALGLRSPFRMRVRPGSGSKHPSDGQPGSIYVGDVGSNQFEELNIITEPGRNLGWPTYEGYFKNEGFTRQQILNRSVMNPLQDSGCGPSLTFEDLLQDPNRKHEYFWPNPCDNSQSLAQDLNVFVHHLPEIAYGNTINNPNTVLLGGFDSTGQVAVIDLNDRQSPVMGNDFDGISSVVGDFYLGNTFPSLYHGSYFHADFSGWIKNIQFDVHDGIDDIHAIRDFADDINSVVYVRYNPFDQALYYVVLDYSDRPNLYQIRKISHTDNPKPVALIEVDTFYGFSPLTVALSAHNSFDPGGETLTYTWIIDQQDTFHFVDSTIVFVSDAKSRNIEVELIVTDEQELFDHDRQLISINNLPPTVDITSITDGQGYRLDVKEFELPLAATASDPEQDENSLTFLWEVKLKHNDHFHLEFVDTAKISTVALPALPNTELDRYAYQIGITVTDSLGLSAYDEILLKPLLSTSIENKSSVPAWRVFPSPAEHSITIESMTEQDRIDGEWRIFDVAGRFVRRGVFNRSPQILSVRDLPLGSYSILIITRGKQSYVIPFSKE